MKINCRIRSQWFVIPCKNGENSIAWLSEEALSRFQKVISTSNKVRETRKTGCGALLDSQDLIQNVLDDNDFVSVILDSDTPDPFFDMITIHNYISEEDVNCMNFKKPDTAIQMDGSSLSTDDLLQLGKGKYKIKLTEEAEIMVGKSRDMVEQIVKENRVVYGITTGFGKFARTVIKNEELVELQENLIRSHASGVGLPLSPNKTRMLLALRINVLAKGYSGISLTVLKQLIEAFNESCLSWVPEQGTVGASGDLAPLSHLALGLMGEGRMWSPQTGWSDAKFVLESHGLKPIRLEAKEGLALINGTQLITSIGVEALERAEAIARQADIVASLTLEVLKGTSRAFDSDVHKIRPHKGQSLVAFRLCSMLHSETYPSEIAQSHRFCNRVQDAYTLRCCPQVHGIVHDTLEFVRGILSVEMNSATDNPIVFSERGEIISAGNFHGEYPAKACDYLAIGIHELASMSERRIERLVNPAYSELPAFLVKNGGLNSGFMLAHCTAAALVSENKTLCHPASVDSLTTSAGTEDHVSMGGFAARKALQVVRNVERVIAIELLAACQAIEFLRPLRTTEPLEEVIRIVRTAIKPWDKDRYMAPDIDNATNILRSQTIWRAMKNFISNYQKSQDVETRVFSPSSYTFGEQRPHCKDVGGSSNKKRKHSNKNEDSIK